MNEEYLKQAKAKAEEMAKARGETFDVRLFITGVSERAAQLAKGYRRLLPSLPDDHTPYLDVALQEVAAGKLLITRRKGGAAQEGKPVAVEITEVGN
jgi:DNA-directed RNA polymerase subunit K/omega